MAKTTLYGKKEIRAAAYNRIAAKFLLKLAEESKEGQLYTAQASLLMSAFTHEAFLNSLGSKIISFWTELEYLKPSQKLVIICKSIGLEPDYGKRPYQTLKALFEFRNTVAHGRDEEIKLQGKRVRKTRSAISYAQGIESKWQSYCTVENAKRALDDVKKIAEELATKANIEKTPGFPFGSPESSIFHAVDENS